MRLTKQEFQNLIIPFNRVIVKPAIDTSKYKIKGTDVEIFIDTSFQEDEHAKRVVEIMKTPLQLVFKKNDDNPNTKSMNWKTSVEVNKGDICWCHALPCINNAENNFENMIVDGEEYYVMPYSDLIIRKDKYCLNGYVLVEPGEIENKTNLILEKQINMHKGIIRHWGKPNVDYMHDKGDFEWDLKDGDIVYLLGSQYPLEGDTHKDFDGKDYWVIQRNRICILEREREVIYARGELVVPIIPETLKGIYVDVKEFKELRGRIVAGDNIGKILTFTNNGSNQRKLGYEVEGNKTWLIDERNIKYVE